MSTKTLLQACDLLIENSKIKPLKPAQISNETTKVLYDMGIKRKEMEHLSQIISTFRYDLCREKVQNIIKRGFKVAEKKIILKKFFSFNGRRYGQCYDIAHQLRNTTELKEWLEIINTRLKKRGRETLVFSHCEGSSPTHFNGSGGIHMFNALHRKSDESECVIIVDASFQVIERKDSTRYRINTMTSDISRRGVKNITIDLGTYDKKEQLTFAVVGVSNDFCHAYMIGFMNFDELVFPVLIRIYPKDGNTSIIFNRKSSLFENTNKTKVTEDEKSILLLLDLMALKIERKQKRKNQWKSFFRAINPTM
ncbi:MAG: hypothetical protein KAI72_05245 [Candidatus Pacebacteria bacterium]|nr:hypothetical protein [Candidatus Paceibacterota bacterium]